jgi:hypothetical protein
MRIAKRLLRRVRDFAEVAGEDRVGLERTRSALDRLGIDDQGLDRRDRAILRASSITLRGRPGGLDTLATAVGEDRGTLEEVHEPYLIQRGLLQRTSRGRSPRSAPTATWACRRRPTGALFEEGEAPDRGFAARRAFTDVLQVVWPAARTASCTWSATTAELGWITAGACVAASVDGGVHLGEVLVRLDLLGVDEVQELLAAARARLCSGCWRCSSSAAAASPGWSPRRPRRSRSPRASGRTR